MLFGRDFAWAHIGKTGGDAAVVLFSQLPDLVVEFDDLSSPCKHHPFRLNNLDPKSYRYWLLNIRRLPSWVVSFAQAVRMRDGESFPIPRSRLLSEARLPDRLLVDYTDSNRYPIHRWLRAEHLRQDIAEFVEQEMRPLSESEKKILSMIPTKAEQPYDHRIERWFTRKECERLYQNNPLWASVERKVYGSLLLDHEIKECSRAYSELGSGSASDPAPNLGESRHLNAEKVFLHGLVHARGPCKICPCF